MDWSDIMKNITEPMEANRQMGNKFKDWINNKNIGLSPIPVHLFTNTSNNAILDSTDKSSMLFAKEKFNYTRNKGLDFIARFNGKYVIAEAKFLTDFGGHQNAQFEDAMFTINHNIEGATSIAILDGVLYGNKTNNKMYKSLVTHYKDKPIMSALLLKDFLYQL